MASRLYRTTRGLFAAVELTLVRLGLPTLGTPTWCALVALAVTGLVLLDERQTQTRVTRHLPARAHDAINRLLRTMPFSTRALTSLMCAFTHRLGQEGYLSIDEVLVEKAFAKKLPWAGWNYYFAEKRSIYGLLIVVLVWCSDDGRWRIPVGFRLWRPKERCGKGKYRTRIELAAELVKDALARGVPARYIVFDTHFTAGWFTKLLERLGLVWQGTLDPKTHVIYGGELQSVRHLASRLKLKWRPKLGVRAAALEVYAPKYGLLRLVVTRNSQANYEYIVSNALSSDLTSTVLGKRSRWSVETVFRDSKQFAGLGACQSWVDQAMVRHVGLVLLTFVVLQMLRVNASESVGEVKARWQLEVLRDGEQPPPPLRACPPELRPTA